MVTWKEAIDQVWQELEEAKERKRVRDEKLKELYQRPQADANELYMEFNHPPGH